MNAIPSLGKPWNPGTMLSILSCYPEAHETLSIARLPPACGHRSRRRKVADALLRLDFRHDRDHCRLGRLLQTQRAAAEEDQGREEGVGRKAGRAAQPDGRSEDR